MQLYRENGKYFLHLVILIYCKKYRMSFTRSNVTSKLFANYLLVSKLQNIISFILSTHGFFSFSRSRTLDFRLSKQFLGHPHEMPRLLSPSALWRWVHQPDKEKTWKEISPTHSWSETEIFLKKKLYEAQINQE